MFNFKNFAFALVIFSTSWAADAATTTQSFDSRWTVSTWDYYGDVAALQWHYVPYTPFDPSLGSLEKVTITTIFSGTKNSTESLAIRYALFTGWSPNQYQFYDAVSIDAGSSSFIETRTFTSGVNFSINNFLNNLFLPQANYYFESRTATTHQIDATTVLTYDYSNVAEVPEPSILALVIAGFSAVGLGRLLKRKTV